MSRRLDRRMMGRALALARRHQGKTGLNPSVGCIILDPEGLIVGHGVTGLGGRPHAEEIALDQAGSRAEGATAYVTLEPCRQRSAGSSPCWQKLARSGITRVVCAVQDSHPLGSGGLRLLQAHGIMVQVGTGRRRALGLYRDFFSSIPASDAIRNR